MRKRVAANLPTDSAVKAVESDQLRGRANVSRALKPKVKRRRDLRNSEPPDISDVGPTNIVLSNAT
jgi:hypothetical protein